jgi:phosphoribosyl-AMP cyclohydrolase / phosphoribosyl-ATP pyrophosphohydrolase
MQLTAAADLCALDFAKGAGLLPAIVQHADNAAVLMLGYMSPEALAATLARGRVVFFSRSRGALWQKGATSGHTLQLVSVHADCDRDALLVRARPHGPTCHLGSSSCFGEAATAPENFLGQLEALIAARRHLAPQASYTARLTAAGLPRMAQKVGEEAVEVVLAGSGGSERELVSESADLLFHLLVLLAARGVPLAAVTRELAARHARGQ